MPRNGKIKQLSDMSSEEQLIVQDIRNAAEILFRLTEEFSNEPNEIDQITLMSKYILDRANSLCATF